MAHRYADNFACSRSSAELPFNFALNTPAAVHWHALFLSSRISPQNVTPWARYGSQQVLGGRVVSRITLATEWRSSFFALNLPLNFIARAFSMPPLCLELQGFDGFQNIENTIGHLRFRAALLFDGLELTSSAAASLSFPFIAPFRWVSKPKLTGHYRANVKLQSFLALALPLHWFWADFSLWISSLIIEIWGLKCIYMRYLYLFIFDTTDEENITDFLYRLCYCAIFSLRHDCCSRSLYGRRYKALHMATIKFIASAGASVLYNVARLTAVDIETLYPLHYFIALFYAGLHIRICLHTIKMPQKCAALCRLSIFINS